MTTMTTNWIDAAAHGDVPEDDVIGLAIGPLFVLAEMGFSLGLRREVQHAIEERAGPVRRRESGAVS